MVPSMAQVHENFKQCNNVWGERFNRSGEFFQQEMDCVACQDVIQQRGAGTTRLPVFVLPVPQFVHVP